MGCCKMHRPCHMCARGVQWFATSSRIRFEIPKPAACTTAIGIGQGSLATIPVVPVTPAFCLSCKWVCEFLDLLRRFGGSTKLMGPRQLRNALKKSSRVSAPVPGCQRNSWVLH